DKIFVDPPILEPEDEWRKPFDIKLWEKDCYSPYHCKWSTKRDKDMDDLIPLDWSCKHCKILDLISSTICNNRLDQLSERFERRGKYYRYLRIFKEYDSMEFLIETSSNIEYFRAWMLRVNDHPLSIPRYLEKILFKRLQYKLKRGSWSGYEEPDQVD
ncbi:MAG: hypothetical protein ACTSQS_11980, partial [Promethearchaeota archaeon]